MSEAADLAQHHQPLGNLFPQATSQDAADAYRLTPEQIDFYQEHGYLAGIRVLDAPQLDALRDELAEFMRSGDSASELWYEYHANESADPTTVLFHALGAWRLGRAFHDLLWHPAVTVPASQLLDGPVRFWHDQLFCKPPEQGGVVAWHQDYSYWTRTRPMAHLTCWIALDDASEENGCLQYLPGSHRWDLLPITGLAGDMLAIRQLLTPAQWEVLQDPLPIELQAGECCFHHPLMVHGSAANVAERPRRATVVNLVRDGVCSSSDEPLLAGVPAIPSGQPLGGRFFPRLYPLDEAAN